MIVQATLQRDYNTLFVNFDFHCRQIIKGVTASNSNNKHIINDCCCFFLNFKLPSERIRNRKIRFDSTYYHF